MASPSADHPTSPPELVRRPVLVAQAWYSYALHLYAFVSPMRLSLAGWLSLLRI
jgi:hypothetical protein